MSVYNGTSASLPITSRSRLNTLSCLVGTSSRSWSAARPARKMVLLQFVFIILVSSTLAKSRLGHSSHTYPHSTHLSGHGSHTPHVSQGGGTGFHSYPGSGTGLSGNGQRHQTIHGSHNTQHATPGHTTRTEVHHHYHYNPPPRIVYGTHTLPVYHGPPPTYVYHYRDSGSRFDTLLTGLALYNLGKMSANHHHHDYNYKSHPGEVCKLVIDKSNGDYEETRIDCQLMSSFIWEAQGDSQTPNVVPKNTVVTSVVTTTNGTTTTVTNTTSTVVDALSVKGPSIQVKPGMKCSLVRISRDYSTIKKTVDCEILQTYAMSSLRRNNAQRVSATLLPQLLLVVSVVYQIIPR